MDSNRPEGLLHTLAGRLQSAVGGVAGNTWSEARGKASQAAGEVQDGYGQILDHVERVASSRPLLVVAAGVGVGFVLGILVARR